MIGLPIGSVPIGGIFSTSSVVIGVPNIILTGTIDFDYFFRIPNRIATYLDFDVITNDDNTVQVNLVNTITSQPILITGVEVNIYAPNTTYPSVLNPLAIVLTGGFQFTIPYLTAVTLATGLYSWVAIVTLLDSTQHTVVFGDINLITGIMRVVERP